MTDKKSRAPKPEDVLIEALMEATGRAATAVYEFEGFRLETGEQRLLKDGRPVSLAPKEFDTLTLLVKRDVRPPGGWQFELIGGPVRCEPNQSKHLYMRIRTFGFATES